LGAKRTGLIARVSAHRWHYAFVARMAALFVVFTLYPLHSISVVSLYEWDGVGKPDKFIGLANFREAILDPYYWRAMANTLVFAASHLVVQVPGALILAVILNARHFRLTNVYRLLVFLPVITTTAVIGLVMTTIFDPLSGPLNAALKGLGVVREPVLFLSSPRLSLPTVIFVSIQKNVGISLIYWLAALQTIPSELYESAEIDGAGRLQQFLRITVPMIAPIGAIIALFAFKNGLYPFDVVQTMTGGGPAFCIRRSTRRPPTATCTSRPGCRFPGAVTENGGPTPRRTSGTT
jgi:raffinose/stachyose/melibiose transport system permease protein